MDGELRKIKKLYGEDFAKFCRSVFPRILEEEGLLLNTLKEAFPPSHELYKALVESDTLSDFKYHIFYRAGFEKYEPKDIDEIPSQLMLRSGYSLYRCEREDDVMQFVRYYRDDELLCTFDDIRDRLEDCDVFFAVSFDAEEIDRSDFEEPTREDKYGTSVISIQFDKYDGSLSIKNRYNHTVDNPDATFSNDLDNICPGLTDSFATHYGLYSKVDYSNYEEFYSDKFVRSNDNRYFHIKRYANDVYFCDENWVVVNGEAIYYDKSRYEIFDYFILDKQEKRIFSPIEGFKDSFMDEFSNIKKIDVEKGVDGKRIVVTKNDDTFFEFSINGMGEIREYENNFQTEVGDYFLWSSVKLKSISIPKVKKIGDSFLESNRIVEAIDCPELEEVGSAFMRENMRLNYLNLPKAKRFGNSCLMKCASLEELNLPEVQDVGDSFLMRNKKLKTINMPKLMFAGDDCMYSARYLQVANFPELQEVGNNFIKQGWAVKTLNVPKLEFVGDGFVEEGYLLETLDFPSLVEAGDYFMDGCNSIEKISLPKLKKLGSKALVDASDVTELSLPELVSVGSSFMENNESLRTLYAPKLEEVGSCFLNANDELTELSLPMVKETPKGFMGSNTSIKKLDMPSLEVAGENFLKDNLNIDEVSLPNVRVVGHAFLMNNESIRNVSMPKLEEVGVFFLCGSMDNLVVVDIPDGVKGLPSGIKEFQ